MRLSKLHRIALLGLASIVLYGCQPKSGGRQMIDLSGSGWRLWLDKATSWENDELFLPPVDLSKVPTNVPTGGWGAIASGIPVAVPGTVEEYLGKGQGPEAQVKGVSWWTRTFQVPEMPKDGILRLQFGSVRLRAEVYVEGRLVAYDLVGNTPFEADLTPLLRDGTLKPGSEARLAVRVTNPGGNCDWGDEQPFSWGKYSIPMSHGFSGITGEVRLLAMEPVYLSDLFLQNSPQTTKINVIATLLNTGRNEAKRSVKVVIREKATGRTVQETTVGDVVSKPGESTVTVPVEVSGAATWDPDHPNLYTAEVSLIREGREADSLSDHFGFRWFSPEEVGSDAQLRLNGKRIVLRTAISWGFWPINGLFPTPELAERQVKVAKAYGLNMLNFHRCIGNPVIFDKADELGLLYFEEPGGYVSGKDDPFAQALSREKLLRMVKRDRNHPSLILYNMINEGWDKWGVSTNSALLDVHRHDLRDAHALDPSRTILYASAWAGRAPDPNNDPAKMHMRPYDGEIHMQGWFDYHRATGPEVWRQEFYKDPIHHYGFTTNAGEIVYWGEEGAVSTPPRLGLIERELRGTTNLGWDGQVYRDWYASFDAFLSSNNLRGAFPTVDDLCSAMGTVAIEHQGRKIEDTRICDPNDGYAINGWEAELIENHSGVVDCFRNPKADPSIMAYYNQPLYVAVKPRLQVVPVGTTVPVDFHLINEKDLNGACELRITAKDFSGKDCFSTNFPVEPKGGGVYGQLLAEGVKIPVTSSGFTTIQATLTPTVKNAGTPIGGHDRVFATESDSIRLSTNGAVLDEDGAVTSFLKGRKGISVPAFEDTHNPLDWIVVTKAAQKQPVPIPSTSLRTTAGQPGLTARFQDSKNPSKTLLERIDPSLNFKVAGGGMPDPRFPFLENYNVVWEGNLLPPAAGNYLFRADFRHGARVTINGVVVMDAANAQRNQTRDFKVTLAAGKPVPIKVELYHRQFNAAFQLLWQTPVPEKFTPEQVLGRVARDGTTAIIADRAETWLDAVGKATGVPQGESFPIGANWLGGQYFVKGHPIFEGLPVNCALNWPYQSVVGGKRLGLDVRGGELVCGAYHTWPMKLGSAVSVVPLGKGRVILSTLDIASQLNGKETTAEVARRLLCNMIRFACRPANAE
jgi:beta-galactosidase